MEMKTVEEYPPNFELIKAALPLAGPEHTYCWGETIYSPDGHEVPPDVVFHESVHARQQGDEPAAWWMRYLSDPNFRFAEEREAYGEQYLFALRAIEEAADKAPKGERLASGKNNLKERALFTIARAFSDGAYGLVITYGEAERLIRRYAKRVLPDGGKEVLP